MAANGCRNSFWDDEVFWNEIVLIVVQLCDYTKCIVMKATELYKLKWCILWHVKFYVN